MVMLVSIGGSENPIIYSIKQHRPEKIIFFVSENSRKVVSEKILPALHTEKLYPVHAFVQTSDAQDIGESMKELLLKVPEEMKNLGEENEWPELVDYTGGTKTMSAALIWASAKFPCQISYVGSKTPNGRIKEGLGVVVDGKEHCIIKENPWDKMAYFEMDYAIKLFNAGQYAKAAEMIEEALKKISDDRIARVLKIFREICRGFYAWDNFDHKTATHLMEKNLQPLRDISENAQIILPGIREFCQDLELSLSRIKKITPSKLSLEMILDLLSNAQRRADIEKKYEDATARCYAAIEKIAKLKLLEKHGIDNSKADPKQIPDELRENFIKKYSTDKGFLEFGAEASFTLLRSLNDETGIRYFEIKEILQSHMGERNRSILGHGIQPMDEEKFKNLFADALFILNVKEDDIPQFPTISTRKV